MTPTASPAATITAHHLLYNRNAIFTGGIRPHYYCLPVLKREVHRVALVEAATSGSPKFFLGTDSAPHPAHLKEHASGCAGCYTAHAAIELYAEAFDNAERAGQAGRLRELPRRRLLRFAAQHGHHHTAARELDRARELRFWRGAAQAAAWGRAAGLEAGMNNTRRVMLLIDADNVSADVIEQAVQRTMAEHGAIHVRRAYCNAEAAVKHQALFKRLSVRPMVNLSAGKNSTDIALAVDALDLVIAERPEVVVLVSSDSDFAPLVIRLREKGCRVCGLGQQGKTGEETTAVYDEFTDLQHQAARAPAAKRTRAARRAGPRRPQPAPPSRAGVAGGRAAHPGCRARACAAASGWN